MDAALKGVGTLLTPAEKLAVDELVAGARTILGAELRHVRLFGSRARGEGTEESDIDVALITTAEGRARRYQVYDLAFDVGLRLSVRLAPWVVAEDVLQELRDLERRIAIELDRDGIPL